ncbi:endonuclease/Exonuclease/phosphatase [Microdochium trichocladiopsis]|uniref:Endonuclease/Exonuclease/phosphatase n=1 Tax=Microdochium trichocladiopsis TaxID=1682393 RepID=A0A9P8Y822_9PEZI|nr:endonuclease/Exonuclease/phosphatase [Microdochium trichocladiopsis]KAH7029797.1 endonuclease/Exonuclease/phosphatase [Microdochium trichocladiopsis]
MQLSHLVVLALAAAERTSAASLPLRITSFNIRYAASSLESGEKPWWSLFCGIWKDMCREPHTTAYIRDIATSTPSGTPALFGLQEVLDNQLSDIKNELGSSWQHVGVGRDDGAKKGEYSPIIYDGSVLRVLYSETKWLSPTPDVVSYGWGAGSRRVVTIGVFEHIATGKRFIHANTHLDNVSSQARSEGIKVAVARIKAVQGTWGPLGATLTGDFNSSPGADAYSTLSATGYLQDLWAAAPHVGDLELTYTGFSGDAKSRLDYIWFGPLNDGKFSATKVEVRENVRDDIRVSDHRPVVGDLVLL